MGMLDGETAIVTGGASGLDEATCRLMANEVALVVVADIQDEKGQVVADAIGASAVYQYLNVTSEDAVAGAIDWLFSAGAP